VTVGDQLASYFRNDLRVWRCPAARVVRDEGGMRAPVNVENGPRPAGPWRPGYMYVSTHPWMGFEQPKPEVWRHFWMRDWMGRNVAGLRVNELNTQGMQAPSEIVLFLDYSSRFHSHKAVDDVYDVPQTFSPGTRVSSASVVHREPFQSNFLYLDGHVAVRQYGWVGGLLNVLHRPIQQRWGGADWPVKYAAGYTNHYLD
jgi:prepilin-type processing-associated H-X9-DG protein